MLNAALQLTITCSLASLIRAKHFTEPLRVSFKLPDSIGISILMHMVRYLAHSRAYIDFYRHAKKSQALFLSFSESDIHPRGHGRFNIGHLKI
jgi:hypothetical protein